MLLAGYQKSFPTLASHFIEVDFHRTIVDTFRKSYTLFSQESFHSLSPEFLENSRNIKGMQSYVLSTERDCVKTLTPAVLPEVLKNSE
jgi:hypothetical protein